jgi:hypothetical protein
MGEIKKGPWHGKVTADSPTPDDQSRTDVAIKSDETISRSAAIPSTSVESLSAFIQELCKVIRVHHQ